MTSSEDESDPASSNLESGDDNEDQFFPEFLCNYSGHNICVCTFISTVIIIILIIVIIFSQNNNVSIKNRNNLMHYCNKLLNYNFLFLPSFTIKIHRSSTCIPPCCKSLEYCLVPTISHEIEPPCWRKTNKYWILSWASGQQFCHLFAHWLRNSPQHNHAVLRAQLSTSPTDADHTLLYSRYTILSRNWFFFLQHAVLPFCLPRGAIIICVQ